MRAGGRAHRRLAPDVYLGVAEVVGPDHAVCDHLVVMRRMPDDRRLSTLVAGGADVEDELTHLARLVASFHARAERSPAADRAAGREALAGRWAANTAGLLASGRGVVEEAEVLAVDALAARYLQGRGQLFARRIREGRALDGHGDLLADDTWPDSLCHHHVAYRAQVRAKVSVIRAGQGGGGEARARRLLAMARRHLEAGTVRLVLVGGLPGTGKSTLATGLADALGATVLRSDELRKELAGLPATQRAPATFGEGLYRPEATAATYGEMLARAGVALGLGESVVLDASWTAEPWRARARELAGRRQANLLEIRCRTDAALAARRIRRRLATGGDASDATPLIAPLPALSGCR